MNAPVLELDRVGKSYAARRGGERVRVLEDLTLAVTEGETVAITGRSGSGKSTLLSLLAGLDAPDAGAVRIDGRDLAAMNEAERASFRGRNLGIVFQQFHLLPHLTALENVALPLELAGRRGAEVEARRWLEAVGLGDRAGHRPAELSGGECQRTAIARALAPKPRMVLADEPTGNLDEASHQGVADLLFRLSAESGVTLVLVTHSGALAARCGRSLSLRGGRLHPAA